MNTFYRNRRIRYVECNKTNFLVLYRGLFRRIASHVTNCFTPLPVVRIIHKHLCRMLFKTQRFRLSRRVGGRFYRARIPLANYSRYYEICRTSPRHFFSFAALYYLGSCVYNFARFFIVRKKQIKVPSSAYINREKCLRRRFQNVKFFPNFFFHDVRNCPTTTNVINAVAKREYFPFFSPFFISHTRNSYATSVPSTQLSYVALILKFQHGRSFARRIQRGCGIILSICRSYINF